MIDLQFFNDGATDEDSVNEVHSEPTKIGLDEDNNVRFIYDEPEPDEKSEEEETPAASTPEPEQAKEQDFYSPEEVRSTDFEKLDPNKIPADMLPWYKSMQAGFTRKTQEIAEKGKELDALLERAKERVTAETRPQVAPEQYFAWRHDFLTGQVAQIFGAELEADTQFWSPAQRLAYDQLNRQLAEAEARQQYEQAEAGRKARDAKSFADRVEAELRALDGAAYEYTLERIKAGDVLEKDKLALAKALTSGDGETVKKYFDSFRKAYYAEKECIKAKSAVNPPRIEGAGGGKAEFKEAPDYTELAKLKSFDEKLAWMRKHGIRP